MNFYVFSALINTLASISLALFVFVKNPRYKNNYLFALFSITVGLWSLCYYFWQVSTSQAEALGWLKNLMAFAIFIPVIYLHFAFGLADLIKKRATILIGSYLLFFVFLFLDLFSPYFILTTHPFLDLPYSPVPGIGFHIFIGIWAGYVIYASLFLFQLQKSLRGLAKQQIKYTLWGLIIGFIGGSTNYFLWYNIPVLPVGNILVSVYVAMTAYAIIRHRFLNINLAIRSILLVLCSSIVIFFLGLAISLLTGILTVSEMNTSIIVTFVLSSIIIRILFPIINNFLQFLLDKTLFGRTLSYEDSIKTLANKLPKILNLNELVDLLINTLMQTMGISRVAVLVTDFETRQYKIVKTVGFNEHNGISDVHEDFLTHYLEKNPNILVIDELEKTSKETLDPTEKHQLQTLAQAMSHIEAAAIIPIMGDRLISLIVLGGKRGGDAYSVEDLNLLQIVASQAAVAIENGRLYNEINTLNHGLQEKVDQATKELQQKNQDLASAYKDLQSLDKMKDQLISVTSHELRTPASIVQNYLWVLLTKPKAETIFADTDKEKLQKALKGIQNLIKLIGDILDISRIEGGKLLLEISSVNYQPIIKEITESFIPKTQNKGVVLSYQSQTAMTNVQADPTRLSEILTNLISNAVKYTDSGHITITTSQVGQMILFNVEDTGKGIATENIPKLFTKFYREDTSLSSSNAETGGTGLGLYITKSLVELMGGKIGMQSTKGQGSLFYFSLPIGQTTQPVPQEVKKPIRGSFTRADYLKMVGKSEQSTEISTSNEISGIKKRVLLVEDEFEMRQFYTDFLTGEGYEVETASDGMEGLAKLLTGHFDLILLDIMMPVLNGVGFLEKRFTNPQFMKIPVILLTNLGEEETVKRCFELGASSLIMKSDVLPNEIPPIIEKVLHEKPGVSQTQSHYPPSLC